MADQMKKGKGLDTYLSKKEKNNMKKEANDNVVLTESVDITPAIDSNQLKSLQDAVIAKVDVKPTCKKKSSEVTNTKTTDVAKVARGKGARKTRTTYRTLEYFSSGPSYKPTGYTTKQENSPNKLKSGISNSPHRQASDAALYQSVLKNIKQRTYNQQYNMASSSSSLNYGTIPKSCIEVSNTITTPTVSSTSSGSLKTESDIDSPEECPITKIVSISSDASSREAYVGRYNRCRRRFRVRSMPQRNNYPSTSAISRAMSPITAPVSTYMEQNLYPHITNTHATTFQTTSFKAPVSSVSASQITTTYLNKNINMTALQSSNGDSAENSTNLTNPIFITCSTSAPNLIQSATIDNIHSSAVTTPITSVTVKTSDTTKFPRCPIDFSIQPRTNYSFYCDGSENELCNLHLDEQEPYNLFDNNFDLLSILNLNNNTP